MKRLERSESEKKSDIRRETSVKKNFKVTGRDVEDIHAIQENKDIGPKFRLAVNIDMYVKWRRAKDMVYHGTDGRYVLSPDSIRDYNRKVTEYKDALVRQTSFSSDKD